MDPPVDPPVDPPEMTTIEIGEVGNIVGLTHNVKNIFLNRSYENPVVFAQSASSNGDDPVVVRVTNVQSDQFQIFLAESSDKNGLHNTGETVTYMVLEAGDYRLTDGTQVNVGTVTTTATVGVHMENTWESISFTNPFDSTPVVLSQIQTQSATGANYLQTRHVSTSSSTVVIALEQEEVVTKPHPAETIGYLAIDSGNGTWNNMAYEAKVRNGLVTANFTQVTYVTPFGEIPNLLTSLTSYVGRDNAHLRYTNPTATGVLLKIEEETTYDSEVEHSIEQISYLAIAGQGMLTALEPQIAIGEVDTVTNLTHVPREIQLKKTYTNPVVFAQSPGTVGMDPVVIRVTNVQPNRFTMYLAEPSNLNGIHNAGETASYVVLEAGFHYLLDGTRLEVGTVETKATVGKIVSNQWEEVGFSNGFETTPVILTQIQTTNPGGQDYLQTRHLSVDNSGFTVALEQAEIQSAQHGVTETIGYLAMEDGTGQWGDLTYEVAKTPIVITDQWTEQSFEESFDVPPAFLSSLSTYFGSDNTHLRHNELSSDGVQIRLEEDTTRDDELGHLAEAVSYLAIQGQGLLLAAVPQWDIGEVGQITNLTHIPQTISLRQEYNHPVVLAQSTTAVGPDPVSVRVRNVQSNRFEIYLTEPSNLNGLHNSAESVTYVVLEQGIHRLTNGTKLEVGTVETNATVGMNLANQVQIVPLTSGFSETPVVISQIQTVAAEGEPYLQTRHLSVSNVAVSLALEQEEAASESHVTETVGYLAIEAGSGIWSGMVYETATSDNVVTHDWHDLEFENYYATEPAFLSSLATYYGYDNAHLSYENLTTSGVQVKVTEDTTADTELSHNSAESVAYFSIGKVRPLGKSVLLSAVTPKIPPQVTAFVRDDGDDTYDTVQSLAFTFNECVTVSDDALQLRDDSVGSPTVNLSGSRFNYNSGSRTATWDFSGISPLPAARYTATLDASKVTDITGLMLDGNGDGATGDSFEHTLLVAVRGDVNLDGNVNLSDFNTLAANYDPLGIYYEENFDGYAEGSSLRGQMDERGNVWQYFDLWLSQFGELTAISESGQDGTLGGGRPPDKDIATGAKIALGRKVTSGVLTIDYDVHIGSNRQNGPQSWLADSAVAFDWMNNAGGGFDPQSGFHSTTSNPANIFWDNEITSVTTDIHGHYRIDLDKKTIEYTLTSLQEKSIAHSGPHPYDKEYSPDSVYFYLGTRADGDSNGFDNIHIVSNGWDQADFDGDGDVDFRDFNAIVKNYSPMSYVSQAASVDRRKVTSTAVVSVKQPVEPSEAMVVRRMTVPVRKDEVATDRMFATWEDYTDEYTRLPDTSSRRRQRMISLE